jgi:hypothetical protein
VTTTCERPRSLGPAARRAPRSAAVLACVLLLLSACALHVKLVGDYDELLDQSVLRLQTSTNEFYARYDGSTPPAKADVDGFLAESLGAIDAMTTRASVLEDGLKRTPLTENLGKLKEQYQELRTLDLAKPPLRTSSRKALDESFKAIQVQLVFMKKTQSPAPAE